MSAPPVAIDARAAIRRQTGGVERVARELSERLPRLAPGRYQVLAPPPALAHRAGHAWEQLALPLKARRAQLILCPAHLAPVASRKTVVGIGDVAPLVHPGWYSRAYAGWQRALLPRIAQRARLVVVPSEFTRGEVAGRLSVPAGRIAVVPHGVSDSFGPDADADAARAKLGLEQPYVLTVGSRIARKNLAALSLAGEQLAREGIELVAAGSGRGYMQAGEDRALRPLGYVPEELLPGLYAGARALAMPSLYEGFGLPCLEAMACGTPVTASDRGALPETCGDAALYADPADPAAFAAALVEAATIEDTRTRLRHAGLERSRGRTWALAAESFDRLLSGLLSAGS